MAWYLRMRRYRTVHFFLKIKSERNRRTLFFLRKTQILRNISTGSYCILLSVVIFSI